MTTTSGTTITTHWAEVLSLRPEIREREGQAAHLQMSLHKAVYQTEDVPYRDASYWCDITEPTPKLTGFLAHVMRRLMGDESVEALFHLDQGMGGGKSHALVGLWHLAHTPSTFLDSDLGREVLAQTVAGGGREANLTRVRPVVLTADNFSPGRADEKFGPATTLHERFLWSLFNAGSTPEGRLVYDRYARNRGSDKAALIDALREVDQPVLILLDELMDYVLALSAGDLQQQGAAEQHFLNALFDAVDDIPNVALVVVMISTEKDAQGYSSWAGEFRDYVAKRLERNGARLSVNEPADFGRIIRRRIFERVRTDQLPIERLVRAWSEAEATWGERVLERLPSLRRPDRLAGRLERSYPFHPDLLDLVEKDWSSYAGYQRVRSTVEIFAASAYWWASEHEEGRWSPVLMGVGDVPLHRALEHVLNSGILHQRDRDVTAYRQLAQNEVVTAEQDGGRAVDIDRNLASTKQPGVETMPARRIATALWLYSLVARSQSRIGATGAELLSAAFGPDVSYQLAEEAFRTLVDPEEGLATLEMREEAGAGTRYALSTEKTLQMFYRAAGARVTDQQALDLLWEWTSRRGVTTPGPAFRVIHVEGAPEHGRASLATIFAQVDSKGENRLVVLDPRTWTLLNGKDTSTRHDIEALLGVGPDSVSPSFAASCVVACVNTYRRRDAEAAARTVLAWRLARRDIGDESGLATEAAEKHRAAEKDLDRRLKRAYQHYCFVRRRDGALEVDFTNKFDADGRSALSGTDVWDALLSLDRATRVVDGAYLRRLVDTSTRSRSVAEVYERFWQDPDFPLVSSGQIASQAVFDALGPDGWELVDDNGAPLSVSSAGELAVNSRVQWLRPASPPEADDEQPTGATDRGAGPRPPGRPPGGDGGGGAHGEPANYRLHEMRMSNVALTNDEARRRMWELIQDLAEALDPASTLDLQLLTFSIEINAAEGALSRVQEQAEQAGASWRERGEDEFLL